MTDRPILFSGPMVRALLDGRKTQTRRVINPQPFADGYYDGEIDCTHVPAQASNLSAFFRFGAPAVGGGAVRTETWEPRYAPGDRLYVREAWRTVGDAGMRDQLPPRDLSPCATWFEADGEAPRDVFAGKFRQGMHMPRWASRLTLIVADVRVERLQEISEADAVAEGIAQVGRFFGLLDGDWDHAALDAVSAYANLWDSLDADRGYGWDANPWVAAYTFTVHAGNVDQIGDVQ